MALIPAKVHAGQITDPQQDHTVALTFTPKEQFKVTDQPMLCERKLESLETKTKELSCQEEEHVNSTQRASQDSN